MQGLILFLLRFLVNLTVPAMGTGLDLTTRGIQNNKGIILNYTFGIRTFVILFGF